jgi:hypothetical protein
VRIRHNTKLNVGLGISALREMGQLFGFCKAVSASQFALKVFGFVFAISVADSRVQMNQK